MVGIRVSASVHVLGILVLLLATTSASSAAATGGVSGSDRSLLQRRSRDKEVKCGESVARSECVKNGIRCRWCRSEALDDIKLNVNRSVSDI
uniref:Uncharacterized protein n=1 Tax=Kalanchoe fedtschenkoi TaxID=63787 RepID=A0A7N0V876_KALFE